VGIGIYIHCSYRPFRETVGLICNQETLVKTYLKVISRHAKDELAWCLFRLPGKGWQTSLDRGRVLLLERVCEAADLKGAEERDFIARAREIEEMLNPAFVHGRRDISTGDDKLMSALDVVDQEIGRVEALRSSHWHLHS